MYDFEILTAGEKDLAELAEFARMTFTVAYAGDVEPNQLGEQLTNDMSDEKFAQMLTVDNFLIARDKRARLIGYVQIGRVDHRYGVHVLEFDASASEVRRLYVLAELQNQKIGSTLLRAALEDPLITQTKTTYITTWETNLGAQKLYQQHGFLLVGEMPEFDQAGAINGYEYILARHLS